MLHDREHLGSRPFSQCCSAHDATYISLMQKRSQQTSELSCWEPGPFLPHRQEGGTSLKSLSDHTEISLSLKFLSREMKSRRGRNYSHAIA